MGCFRVARASEYLAITGWGVDDVKVTKKAWVWLGQRCTTLDAAPASYELKARGINSENFPVVLRAVYTVGPRIDNADEKLGKDPPLLLYAKLVSPASRHGRSKELEDCSSRVKELVQGAIERHVGALAAGMTLEQIFIKGRTSFMKEILERVRLDLVKFGICVYSANVKRLVVHVPASKYLSDVLKTSRLGAATGFPVQMVVEGSKFDAKKLIEDDGQLSKTAVANDTQEEWNSALNRMLITHTKAAAAEQMLEQRKAMEAVAQRFMEQEWPKIMSVAMGDARKVFTILGGRDTRPALLAADRFFQMELPKVMTMAMDNACKAAAALLVGGDTSSAQLGTGVLPAAGQELTGVAVPAEGKGNANC